MHIQKKSSKGVLFSFLTRLTMCRLAIKQRTSSALLVAVLCFAALATASAQDVLWSDNFNAPDNNSLDASDQAGRHSGTYANDILTRSSKIQHGIVDQQLNFLKAGAGSGRVRFHQAADVNTWFDFAAGGLGADILAAGGFRVEFDWIPGNNTSDNWISFCAGISGQATAEPGVRVNDAQTDIGILFRFRGATQVFNNGPGIDGGNFDVSTVDVRHIRIDYHFASFADGTSVTMIATVDGMEVWNTSDFDWNNNGGSLYLELGTYENTRIDNLQISTLPEPPLPTIVNNSFEADTFTAYPGYVRDNTPITGWASAGGAGINPASGSPFADNGTIPDGIQVAFIQDDSVLSQVVNGFVIGKSYQIRYLENARNGNLPSLAVTVGGNVVVAEHPVSSVGGSNPYREVVSDPFVADATSLEIAFVKTNPQGGDNTVLIDNVGFLPSDTPPSFVLEPQSQVAGLGETVTLNVVAVGSAPLAYQWYLDGNEIPGATEATLSFLVEFGDQAGNYTVTVSNGTGSTNSQPAALKVRASVPGLFDTGVDDSKALLPDGATDQHYTLTANPDSGAPDAIAQTAAALPGAWLANTAGSRWIGPLPDTVGALAGEYVYQLSFDLTGVDIPTLVITGQSAVDDTAVLRVNGVDTGEVNNNGYASLTPFTLDSSNANFQDGLNTLEFVIQNGAVGYTGLRVQNLRGLAVLPNSPPSIVQQPVGALTGTGKSFTFSVVAEGSSSLSYQWQKDAADIPGATSPTLTLNNLALDDAGTYSVVVSNPFGNATSDAVELAVRNSIPGIFNTGVDDFGAALPDSAIDPHYVLVVNPHSGSQDAIVQDAATLPGAWLANSAGSRWIGPEANTAGIGAVGVYRYRLTFDLTGFDPSTAEILGAWTCDNPGLQVYLNGQPTGITNAGNFGALNTFAINSGFLAGQNTLDFEVENLPPADYTGLRVDNLMGLGDLLPAGTMPFIVDQPVGMSVVVTETASFSVRANGSAPLSYQWYYGPDQIPGETAPTLSFLIDFPDFAGEYSVEVSNPYGSVQSDPAILVVSELPSITGQPQDQYVAAGDPATFSVQAIGTPPLGYQWMYSGNDIPGADQSTFTIPGVFPEDAGPYSVRVIDYAGFVTSTEAILTVGEAVPGFYNTGVDDSGVALPDGAADSHYVLIVNPDSSATEPLVEDSTVFPIVDGPWVPNTDQSKWIGPRLETSAAAGAADAGGDYVYRLTIDLTGFDPATAFVTGEWSSDNNGLDILINGVSTGQANPDQFGVYAPFRIDAGFVTGLNTIDFRVNNASVGYTGLYVRNLRGIAVSLPEGTLPFIVQQPDGTTLDQGQSVTLSVLANGSVPLSYQWYFGQDALTGETGRTLSFVAQTLAQSGDYSVEVTNPFGSLRSDPATVTVIALPNQPPSFTPGSDVTVPEDAGPQEFIDWATNIQPGSPFESEQTVTFVVSTDNEGLFAELPTISPAGTLTFTPAPGLCGVAQVTAMLQDDGGTDNGGQDTSDPAEFTITVEPVNDCPVPEDQSVIVDAGMAMPITLVATDADAQGCGDFADLRFWVVPPSHGQLRGVSPNLTYVAAPEYCGMDSFIFLVDDGICFSRGTVTIEVHGVNQCPVADAQLVTTCEDSPVAITLTGSDPDENGCGPTLQSFAIASQPAHGTLTGTAPNVAYTPAADYNGMDSFTFTATDGECVSDPAVVSIQVQPANDGPVCHIVVGPLLQITPDVTENLVLSCDNQTAEVVLDATLCSDPENNALTYVWQVDGLPVGNEAILSTTLPLGTHEVTLTVDDGNPGTGECAGEGTSSTGTTMVTVIDGCEAVEELVLLVEQSNIDAKLKSTFNKHLKDACKKLAKGRCQEGVKQLQSFQDKVRNYDEFYKSPSKKRKSAKQLIDHETAQRLIDGSQAVIDAYAPCACMGWR